MLIADKEIAELLNHFNLKNKLPLSVVKLFLRVDTVNRIYEEEESKKGLVFIDSIIEKLGIEYSLPDDYYKYIPASGPFIIIANHPLGLIDGLLLLKIVCRIRPDFRLLGNFLIMRIEPVRDYFLPVNPFENYKSLQSSYSGLKAVYQHLEKENSVGIFPSGEVSSLLPGTMQISDREWQNSVIKLIRNSKVPVIPVHINAYNSPFFYLAGLINPLIRTALLPSEALNKRGTKINIHFGQPVLADTIKYFTMINDLSRFLRTVTYTLKNNEKNESIKYSFPFTKKQVYERIAEPVYYKLLEKEIVDLPEDSLMVTKGDFYVYCCKSSYIPNILREIGRLREITFREAGEGSKKSIDLDKYDIYYYHMFIWDNYNKQIAGSYRIGKGKEIINFTGNSGFYINSLFKTQPEFEKHLDDSLELGRSFITKKYQKQHFTLLLLWKGIYAFLQKNPEYRYLIGPVSISNNYSLKSKSLIVQFLKQNHYDYELSPLITPLKQFRIPRVVSRENIAILEGIENDTRTLDIYLNRIQPGFSMPVLLRKYLQMNGKAIGFNIDPEFNDCLDVLVIADKNKLPPEMMQNLSRNLRLSSDIELSSEFRYSKSQAYN
jgi:putative hemolysin